MTRYCFDIDGVICDTVGTDYMNATPKWDIITHIQKLHREGNDIWLYTARGSGSGKDWSDVTKEQMKRWDVPYTRLAMGKPAADIFIDDKAVNFFDWLEDDSRHSLIGRKAMRSQNDSY
jgi:CMP-N,N'-diacetyllegionaminic acid synthase